MLVREKNLELYHHGVKGQKWGVRRRSNKSNDQNRQYGALSSLMEAARKMNTSIDQTKYHEEIAQGKRTDIDKLNYYHDLKKASEFHTNTYKSKLDRYKKNQYNDQEKMLINFIGEKEYKKSTEEAYNTSSKTYQYAKNKTNEMLNKMKDVPIEKVKSYREFTSGNTTTSWNGTAYKLK